MKKISAEQRKKIFEALKNLAQDPFARQQNTKLLNPKEKKIYRLKIGTWRIIYSVDAQNQIIIVHQVGLRRDVYKN